MAENVRSESNKYKKSELTEMLNNSDSSTSDLSKNLTKEIIKNHAINNESCDSEEISTKCLEFILLTGQYENLYLNNCYKNKY